MKPKNIQEKNIRYFTLVELLAVCGIIMILVGIGIGVYSVAQRKSAESKCEAMIKKMCIALEAYKDKTGYYIQQSTVGAFYVDIYKSVSGDEFNLNDCLDIPDNELATGQLRGAWIDSFGREFRYQCPGAHNRGSFDLRSQGADTTTTADDVKNW
jgi:type II secretory pathway pseudopilin PulG